MMIASIVGFTSCVSSSKFKESEAKVQQLESDLGSCKSNVASVTASLNSANTKIADLNGLIDFADLEPKGSSALRAVPVRRTESA